LPSYPYSLIPEFPHFQAIVIGCDYKFNLRGYEEGTPEYEEQYAKINLRSAQRILNLCLKNAGLLVFFMSLLLYMFIRVL